MKIEEFVQNYTLESIIEIETYEDMQYRSLLSAWEQIHPIYGKEDHVISTFLWMTIQASVIAYQISGSGESRWRHFGNKLADDFENVLTLSDHSERWEYFLTNITYNQRIPKMKTERIKKVNAQRHHFFGGEHLHQLYHNMVEFNTLLASCMKQKPYSKTVTFGTKMFGYGSRIIFQELVYFPYDVAIPVDSRLTQIYQRMHKTEESYSSYILNYYNNLGKKYGIPPLHLDSLLWIKYRDLYFSKYRGAGTEAM